MRFKQLASFIFFPLFLFLLTTVAEGQQGKRYRMANNLMNQQQFKQAYNIYIDLLRKHPQEQTLYDRSVKCLVNMKEYGEAIEISKERIQDGHSVTQTSIRLGNLYHLKGDTSRAFEVWDQVLSQQTQLQTYLEVARTMKDRNEFDRAIDVYHRAKKHFNNEQLFANELSYTYQMAGQYEKAVRQYLKLIKNDPGRINFVKRSMMRFKDDYLYEVAVIEFNNFLSNLSADHRSYRPIHKLYRWLLLEMNLYERAVAEAKNFEQKTGQSSKILFKLGERLLSQHKFELAEEAFAFYRNSNDQSLQLLSMEKLGDVYMQWADYISDYNLIYTAQRDSLYKKANSVYNNLLDKKGDSRQIGRVLTKQAELALDYLKDLDKAEFFVDLMRKKNQVTRARTQYIEGRIRLYQDQFDRARIAFTNSYKASDEDHLADKSRYYLALTNFFSGDFEYAQLQLKALEKQSSSYYANDAIQLKMWMQDGMQKDSATTQLREFSTAIHHLKQGRYSEAIASMSGWLNTGNHPLSDDAILALAQHARTDAVPAIYTLLTNFLQSDRQSPLKERLLWERARIAEQIVKDRLQDEFNNDARSTAEERLFTDGKIADPPESLREVQKLYEKILLQYPQGFYSSYARDRIQKLENTQT